MPDKKSPYEKAVKLSWFAGVGWILGGSLLMFIAGRFSGPLGTLPIFIFGLLAVAVSIFIMTALCPRCSFPMHLKPIFGSYILWSIFPSKSCPKCQLDLTVPYDRKKDKKKISVLNDILKG